MDAPVDVVDRYLPDAPPRLTAADRCDQCGSQAYTGATVNGTELLFCLHHFNRNARALSRIATHTRMQLPDWYRR